MGRFLNPGNVGFKQIIKPKTYVDKTGILAYLNEWIDTDSRFVCVSRARRLSARRGGSGVLAHAKS